MNKRINNERPQPSEMKYGKIKKIVFSVPVTHAHLRSLIIRLLGVRSLGSP